jgi:serine protease Do
VKGLKIVNPGIAFGLFLSLILATGCYQTVEPENPPPSPTQSASQPAPQESAPADNEWQIPTTGSEPAVMPSYADVVDKVKPSVVAIATEVTGTSIFGEFTQEGAGSGWIIDEDGLIVTNNHVVQDAESITVTLDDGRTFSADMDTVATDPLTELAIFEISAEDLTAVEVGDSSMLRIGNRVVAIGNSMGQGIRATQGIVSRMNVSLEVSPGQELLGLIETDAAINPGNSGGPLVNMSGEVIGINSVKAAMVEVEGVGWAISTNTATPIIEQLVNKGYVVRPWLGVGLYTIDPYVVQRYGLAVDEGALVTSVATGSPAEKAGLEAGDIITKFDGAEVINVKELTQAIHSSEVGQDVEITFWRGEEKRPTTAALVESPPPQ